MPGLRNSKSAAGGPNRLGRTMLTFWRRLRLLIRELGWVGTLLFGVDRLLRRLRPQSGLVYYRFVAQPLAAQARLPEGRARHYVFRLVEAPDAALDALQRPASVLAARFAQGAQCLLATRAQALVGCIWFVRGSYREDEVRVDYHLPRDGSCVWDFDVFVAPTERLGFLFARQWDVFDALLRPQGVTHSISRINGFNRRSLASHHSLGAQDCGWALFVCLGGTQMMLSGVRPYVAVGGRPELSLRP